MFSEFADEFDTFLEERGYRILSKVAIGQQLKVEGFPQSFLEMTMCGVPVAYGGPKNSGYFFPENAVLVNKKASLLQSAEHLLKHHNAKKCSNTLTTSKTNINRKNMTN